MNATVPAEFIQAAKFHVARAMFHSAHVVQAVTALLAGLDLALRRNRDPWPSGIALVISVVFVWLGVVFGTFPNVGFPFGYYGKFNRVRAILDSCEGLRVVSSWKHRDVTLEDFGFMVRQQDGKTLKLEFSGSLPLPDLIASLPEVCR